MFFVHLIKNVLILNHTGTYIIYDQNSYKLLLPYDDLGIY